MAMQLSEQPLIRPTAGPAADQCREMGLSVGDTIIGREEHGNGWNEARLTLLWLGESVAVWREQIRHGGREAWSEPREETGWSLGHRQWYRVDETK